MITTVHACMAVFTMSSVSLNYCYCYKCYRPDFYLLSRIHNHTSLL